MPRHPSSLRLLVLAALLGFAADARAIIDGTDASPGDFPWIAGIVRKDVAAPGLVGGGTLIGDQWVITAAHSVRGLSPSRLEVWLGITDLGDTVARRVFGVLAVYVHPDFSTGNGTSVNDLALLLLDRPVTGIGPLPLVDNDFDLAEGDAVRVAGWGISTLGLSQPSEILQQAPAKILSQAEAEVSFGPVIGPGHLAAVDPDEIATPCVGDSGSPLVKRLGGSDHLAGLVSFGTADCDDASRPTIYTRIPHFAPWIQTYLDLTASPSRLSLAGKGRAIRPGSTPHKANGTHFGTLTRRYEQRVVTYRLTNRGSGLLTLSEVTVTGRGFSLTSNPTRLLPPSGSVHLRVRFASDSRLRRSRGRILLRSNDPTRPVFVLRVEATQDRS